MSYELKDVLWTGFRLVCMLAAFVVGALLTIRGDWTAGGIWFAISYLADIGGTLGDISRAQGRWTRV